MDEISCDQARSIAGDLLRLSKESARLEIDRVINPLEWNDGKIGGYFTRPSRIEDCWLVILRRPEFFGLRSTDIMLIDRASGRLVYFGDAGDEG
ncbi:MAG TPA: hypothetical protein VN660_01780 [Steroidobacteraceae bacterium]|nr:hypothetical protein [Steroidobacteraceae bacterium]